jgi:dienelactone hydrolase
MSLRITLPALVFLVPALVALGDAGQPKADLAAGLRDLEPLIAPGSDRAKLLSQMVGKDIKARRDVLNQQQTKAWQSLKSREDWEKYRDAALAALRKSLGEWPEPPKHIDVMVTGSHKGDGFVVDNLVFLSRPHLVVTANLYRPAKAGAKMPGILLSTSHHNPKTQGELQDMGMTWARQGCYVLVPDHLGHGERRQHPFSDAKKYPEPFKADRQDYYFRYNVAEQLHVVGESLMGWMVWDLMRCVDVLDQQPGIDKNRIILLGAVAGGGDPAAVTAALDQRISAVVPFNFGGPQPETTFPLPADADAAFNYLGGGSWESTRNLRLSGPGGFAPWVIVGAAAPRPLIYAHEFAWDRDHDPVWKRLEKIYGWYGVPERLAGTAGRGSVTGKPPESTHCNNIGPEHRKGIYPAFKQWFDMLVPDPEYRNRLPAADLLCLTPKAVAKLEPWPVHKLALEIAEKRTEAARQARQKLTPEQGKTRLREQWAALLGDVTPAAECKVTLLPGVVRQELHLANDGVLLHVPGKGGGEITIPVRLLKSLNTKKPRGVVVAVAQEGGQGFLKHRAATVGALLEEGFVVCLPDLRGTGATRPAGDSRERQSTSTSLSAADQMLGRTLLGDRLRDLLQVLGYVRDQYPGKETKVLLWGDSFAPVNGHRKDLGVPLELKQPYASEPLGGLVTLLAALYDDRVNAVYSRGGLGSYLALLDGPFVQVPHDAVVPGALTVGDLSDVVAALAPRAVWLEKMVDGLNRPVPLQRLERLYAPALDAYQKAGRPDQLTLHHAMELTPQQVAAWFVAQAKS